MAFNLNPAFTVPIPRDQNEAIRMAVEGIGSPSTSQPTFGVNDAIYFATQGADAAGFTPFTPRSDAPAPGFERVGGFDIPVTPSTQTAPTSPLNPAVAVGYRGQGAGQGGPQGAPQGQAPSGQSPAFSGPATGSTAGQSTSSIGDVAGKVGSFVASRALSGLTGVPAPVIGSIFSGIQSYRSDAKQGLNSQDALANAAIRSIPVLGLFADTLGLTTPTEAARLSKLSDLQAVPYANIDKTAQVRSDRTKAAIEALRDDPNLSYYGNPNAVSGVPSISDAKGIPANTKRSTANLAATIDALGRRKSSVPVSQGQTSTDPTAPATNQGLPPGGVHGGTTGAAGHGGTGTSAGVGATGTGTSAGAGNPGPGAGDGGGGSGGSSGGGQGSSPTGPGGGPAGR